MNSGKRLAWVLVGTVCLAGGGIAVMSQQPLEPTAPPPLEPTLAGGGSAVTPQQRTQFAQDRQPPGWPKDVRAVVFDGARAMRYLKQVCDIGPRVSGSEGMKKQVELLQKHFTGLGAQVELQRFSARQLSQRQPVEMVNVIARWHPERARRLIICSHYDTRPIADQEPDRRDWYKPFVSANDGGSGVAFLMEMAHHLKELPLHVGVDFVLFDGEEYIFDNTPEHQGGDKYFFGSEYFASQYAINRRKNPRGPTYVEAVLLDMIAGKQPHFRVEGHSYVQAGVLVEKIWRIAGEVNAPAFIREVGQNVRDDHLALLEVGIPAIDIVPSAHPNAERFLTYPHWHLLSDVPENCAPDGMEQIGRVLAVWMQRAR
jgi:glutaminyl-peptide cyclotransferase